MDIKIGGREIPLFYSTYEMIAIQEEIGCTAYQVRDEVLGLTLDDEDDPTSWRFGVATDPEKTKKLGTLIRILGNAGLEEKGEPADLTDKWVMRNMKPGLIVAYAVAAWTMIVEGHKTEAPGEEEEKGPVDEGLEEELGKKEPGK